MALTAIQNVQVFDGFTFSNPSTVFINGDKLSFHESSPVSIIYSNPASIIDGSGKYLIPGLIDSHVHVHDVSALEQLTSFGVTTALNMALQTYSSGAEFRDSLRSSHGLASWYTAGMAAFAPNTSHSKMQTASDPLTSIDQVSERVSEAFDYGSDYFKLVAEPNGLSQQVQDAMVKAVHSKGKKTMTHASYFEAFKQAINSKTDGVQHVAKDRLIERDMIAQMVTQKQTVTPTMTLFRIGFNNSAIDAFVDSFRTGSYDIVRKNVKALHEAGVPILAGTDSIGSMPALELPYGSMLHQELENLVDAGLTPGEAIRAATSMAAKFHDLHDRGVIGQGKRADLVLLNANPLANISNTQRISHVWVGGHLYQKAVN